MPRRTPSGRVRRSHKEKRRAAPPTPAKAVPAADTTPSISTTARATSTTLGRPSLLANVRRPARPTGPALVTDYAYVVSDLRRIGVLAGVAFALLIALTFVIR